MLKKSVAKYLYGTKDDILARLKTACGVKIATSNVLIETESLRRLGIPNLPTEYPTLFVTETIAENLPRARRDMISLMEISSRDGSFRRSVILTSSAAPPGKLYGYFRDLSEVNSPTKR